jgi:hypothetical protein
MIHDAGTDNIKPSAIFNFMMRKVLRTARRREDKQSDGEFDYFYFLKGHVWIESRGQRAESREHQNRLIITSYLPP